MQLVNAGCLFSYKQAIMHFYSNKKTTALKCCQYMLGYKCSGCGSHVGKDTSSATKTAPNVLNIGKDKYRETKNLGIQIESAWSTLWL